MKLLEQTRCAWQGNRLRDKVLSPLPANLPGLSIDGEQTPRPQPHTWRDSNQEHRQQDVAWGWACPVCHVPSLDMLIATKHHPGPLPHTLLVWAA